MSDPQSGPAAADLVAVAKSALDGLLATAGGQKAAGEAAADALSATATVFAGYAGHLLEMKAVFKARLQHIGANLEAAAAAEEETDTG